MTRTPSPSGRSAPLRSRSLLGVALWLAAVAAGAQVRFLADGAVANPRGGWDLPPQGGCPAGAAQGHAGIDTRPECSALRVALPRLSCTGDYAWVSGACNDPARASQAACEAAPDRLWNPGLGLCAIVMMDEDRNDVTCARLRGFWDAAGTCTGAWILPGRTAYSPSLLTGNATGDQCLRCHNGATRYNAPRSRDAESTLAMGHRNMARPVAGGLSRGGPPFGCSIGAYPTAAECVGNGGTWDPTPYPVDDAGDAFDWAAGTLAVGGEARELEWIFGGWTADFPRAIYAAPPSANRVCTDPRDTTQADCEDHGGAWVLGAGLSYSCGRCHTTGWSSDAALAAPRGDPRTDREPERSFPGITWDRLGDAPFGVVDLAGELAGDPDRYSSWDLFGVTCSRCHGAAVELTRQVPGYEPPLYNPPVGMSSHHSQLTGPDAGAGYCTDSRFNAQAQCDAAGAAWLTGCSLAGVCSLPAYPTSGTCRAGGGSWTTYNTQPLCLAAGETWYIASCDVAGVCNDPAYTTRAGCEAGGGQWAAATDIVRCEGAGGRYTGTKTNRGQVITALCMECHRQETGGRPWDGDDPARALKVGPAHGTVDFVSHPTGNQFLNGPHGLFTGSFAEIPLGQYSTPGGGLYGSPFLTLGAAANTGNGCSGCHDVHVSTVTGERPLAADCTACHDKPLDRIRHPQGGGTPIDPAAPPWKSCSACHMPGGSHLFRIRVDPSFATFPMPAALAEVVDANTAPDGDYPRAVWSDLDLACGRCHGGGLGQATTTGAIAAGSATLTVASSAGFTVGQKVDVPGAGALAYDAAGHVARTPLESYVREIPDATTITLAGEAAAAAAGVTVAQNATHRGAGYMDKDTLAGFAAGMHDDKPQVTFGWTLGSPDTLTVLVDGSGTVCFDGCDVYTWSWGDGAPDGSGATATHTYAAGGTYPVTLTVEDYGLGTGSLTRDVTVYAADLPPVVAGACSFDSDTWTETVTDASTDDHGVVQVTVNWGDGTMVSSDTTPPFGPFVRTYISPGTFTLTHRAVDTIGQQSSRTCTVNPAYFAIGGTVYRSDGTTPVSAALVQVRRGGSLVRSVYTNGLGAYSVGSLRPGTYTLTVTRPGFVFPAVPPVTVGPSQTAVDVIAVSPAPAALRK